MQKPVIVSCLIGMVVAAGCRSATDPRASPWHPETITNIRLPATAAATDTVIVRFSYLSAACANTSSVEARQSADVLLFTVSTTSTSSPCPDGGAVVTREVAYTVFPLHPVPLRIAFTRPGAPDSVRVISE